MQLPKPSKQITAVLLSVALLLGVVITIYQVQLQQELRQRAWNIQESAVTACSPNDNTAIITVSFTNEESDRDIDVTAKDLQTGQSISMGTVAAGETASNVIETGETELSDGAVLFSFQWTDNSPGNDSRSAAYEAISECPSPTPTPPVCTEEEKTTGYCRWDSDENATEYEVTITDSETGEVISSETLPHPASQSAFLIEPNKTYQCNVTAINECGSSDPSESDEKSCPPPPTATPTPPPPYCPTDPENTARCVWDPVPDAEEYTVSIRDADTGDIIASETITAPDTTLEYTTEPGKNYICSVAAVNQCTETEPVDSPPNSCTQPSPTPTETPVPTPTPTVTPTGTPVPTVPLPTPTPTITPTPTLTPTPTITPTPTPTATPFPTATPRPPIAQQPPAQRSSGGSSGGQQVVQQPAASAAATPTTVAQGTTQATPVPTLPPTGDSSTTMLVSIAAIIFTVAGAVLFFAL